MSAPNIGIVRDLIPARARQVIYAGYVAAGLVVGAIGAWYGFYGAVPKWVGAALAVLAFVAVPISALAAVNTSPAPLMPAAGEDDGPRHLSG